ncbi:hypothetical protein JW905_01325 [bacterium]|nr:hypothetical protein [candidate division CSSED10-310 bacterium]
MNRRWMVYRKAQAAAPRLSACALAVWLLVLCAAGIAGADMDSPPGGESTGAGTEDPDAGIGQSIDHGHRMISSRVNDMACWVDAFFADPNYVEEDADARLELRQRVFLRENAVPTYRVRVGGRLSLPNVSRRLNLIFAGNEDDSLEGADQEDFHDAVEESLDAPFFGARFFILPGNILNLSFTAGTRFGDLALFAGPRLRLQKDLNECWLGRLVQLTTWNTDFGWHSTSTAELDRRFTERTLFRHSLRAIWQEDTADSDGVRYTVAFKFLHRIDEHRALRCRWSSDFHSQPEAAWRTTELSVNYRSRIYRRWLFVEVTPFIVWERERHWGQSAGIYLAVDLIFEKNDIALCAPAME